MEERKTKWTKTEIRIGVEIQKKTKQLRSSIIAWVNIYLAHGEAKAVWGVATRLLLKVLKTKELTALFYDVNEMFRGV